MIRHLSVFKLKKSSEIEKMKELLEEIGNTCPLILHSEVGENMSHLPAGQPGPLFGDLVQIVDFRNMEDCIAYPASKEHLRLVEEGPEMDAVMACDWEVR